MNDLGRNYALSGRVVYETGQTGGYLAFRRSGNRGNPNTTFILGDPNAARFRASFLLKVVTPIDVGL